MRTFTRRPGNKTNHLKHIIPLIPQFTGTYYEPFLGTGAVYLKLLPKKAVLNDLNKDTVNIWNLVKRNPKYIIDQKDKFKKIFLHLSNEDKLKLCKNILSKMDTYTGDRRTVIYLLMVYCSFSGCILVNNKYSISGLYGCFFIKRNFYVLTEAYNDNLFELQKILKNVKIENKDYAKVLVNTKKGDFVFLDPPYIEDFKYAFNYNKDEYFDPRILKKEVEKLDKKEVKWMMTQIDTKQVRELFKKYKFTEYINKSNFNSATTQKKELVITNY